MYVSSLKNYYILKFVVQKLVRPKKTASMLTKRILILKWLQMF